MTWRPSIRGWPTGPTPATESNGACFPLASARSEAISLSSRTCDRRTATVSGDEMMGYRVAVVGATGNVGREILNILAERQFPLDEVAALASARSTGDVIEFGETGETLTVRNLEHFDFTGWDIALFAAG